MKLYIFGIVLFFISVIRAADIICTDLECLENNNAEDIKELECSLSDNKIPSKVFELKNLEKLSLTFSEITSIPPEIGNLTNLIELDLSYNEISSIPSEIGNLTNLSVLKLGYNKITSIPSEFGNLTNLTELDLSGNEITTISSEFGSLTNLTKLDLSATKIVTVPSEIGNLTNLTKLDLGVNSIVTIPSEIVNLTNLSELNLKYNEITSVPQEIGNLTNLQVLDLSENEITSVPPEIGNLKNLTFLNLLDNNITIIPSELANLSNAYIQLQFNQLVTIPTELLNKNNLILDGNPMEHYYNVYLYNAYENKCLRTTGEIDTPLTYGACDNSEYTVWIIKTDQYGQYHSRVNPDYCIGMEDDGVISLKSCNDVNNEFYRDGNFIKPVDTEVCLGSAKDSNQVVKKACDENDPDQIFYYNIWDPSIVFEEEPTQEVLPSPPETVTIYFYNAIQNKCITSDGSSVSTGNCFNNDAALWEIPITHDGYYRPKANPEKCLTIVDGSVALSECDENTTLYRDGNFIRSPLSDDRCIASSSSDNALTYVKGCQANNSDHIWYFNIWTAPETESTTEVIVPTTVSEENQTVTITSTVTAVMTEAY